MLEQHHVVSAQGGHARGLHAGGAAAHHDHLLRRVGGLYGALVLVAVLGVQHAREEAAVLDGVGAALVAHDARADELGRARFEFAHVVGIGQERATEAHVVARAAFDEALGIGGAHDAAHGGHRHAHGLLHATGRLLHEAIRARAHGGDGVVQVAGVVGLSHMEGVHARLLQKEREPHGFVDE